VVIFAEMQYVIQSDDPNPLPDQANVLVTDLCDSPTTMGCSGIQNAVQFTASTIWCDPDDGDLCTTDTCDDGICTNTPVTCDDGNACTTEACNPSNGQCETTDEVVCDDGNECTTEECNTTTGQCETTDVVVCDDGNACTSELCNTETGQCETVD
jgi:hypothetical protein